MQDHVRTAATSPKVSHAEHHSEVKAPQSLSTPQFLVDAQSLPVFLSLLVCLNPVCWFAPAHKDDTLIPGKNDVSVIQSSMQLEDLAFPALELSNKTSVKTTTKKYKKNVSF